MVHSIQRWLTPGALVLAAWAAQAQTPASAPRPDPLDPQAKVPALNYRSSFARERRPEDDKPISWREANDTATRIGGWRVYAREAQQAEPVVPAASAASAASSHEHPTDQPPHMAKPMPHGQGGHKKP